MTSKVVGISKFWGTDKKIKVILTKQNDDLIELILLPDNNTRIYDLFEKLCQEVIKEAGY